MLNSQSPVPLYHQLADILMQRIQSGEYLPGQMIPSETGLAKQYGIGRPTVRQAMDTLVQKGLIQRKRGSGTFVKEMEPKVNLFSLAGTSQAFLTKGIDIEKKIISPTALKAVQDAPGNPFNNKNAFFLTRLILAEKEPVLLEEIFLDPELFLGIDQMDLESKSLSRVVEDAYYLSLENGIQTFKTGNLQAASARLMNLDTKETVLVVTRELNFPKAPAAIFSTLYCRTDTFAFSQTIQAEGSL